MDKDIYTPPESLLVSNEAAQQQLAARSSRFAASFVDGIIMMVILLPLMYMAGGFEMIKQGQQPGLGYSLLMGIAGLIVFLVVNYRLLLNQGQTVGKKLLSIRIVDGKGGLPSGQSLLKRYVCYFVPAQIPVIGAFFSLINLLFIFGSNRRCLHDVVAGTNVVKNSAGR